jgi:hypothetical protein
MSILPLWPLLAALNVFFIVAILRLLGTNNARRIDYRNALVWLIAGNFVCVFWAYALMILVTNVR